MSSTHVLVLLTAVLAAGVVLVLAVALIEVRRGLTKISEGLATLATALQGVDAEHLRPLEGAVKAINAQFDIILGALVLAVGIVVVVYGLLMLFFALRLEPSAGGATRTVPRPAT